MKCRVRRRSRPAAPPGVPRGDVLRLGRDMTAITIPKRQTGRQSAAAIERYDRDLAEFCAALEQIDSTLEFKVSSRGWCYLLEEYGLNKGDFDSAQGLINDCRKDGRLPIDFVLMDQSRAFDGQEVIWHDDAVGAARYIVKEIAAAHLRFTPRSFWDDKDVYIQAVVEKIDLKNIFGPVFKRFRIPYANAKGWGDLNIRADMMRRFQEWEDEGKDCVLLYFGDHDPGGLQISEYLRSNMEDLADAIGWSPEDLTIDRFGLNHDFIEEHGLIWIDNLETSSRRHLDDPRHPDHHKSYVQDYIEQFGVRKVEANALVTRIEAGRELCLQAILKYLGDDDPDTYEDEVQEWRQGVKGLVSEYLEDGS